MGDRTWTPAPRVAALARGWPAALLAAMIAVWFAPVRSLHEAWWVSHTDWSDPLRALAVVDAWRHAVWDARWFPGFDQGYGYPFLSYYAPLFHWGSGLWVLLLESSSAAVRANLAAWLAVGTAGAYLAGARFWDAVDGGADPAPLPGFLCAAAWLGSPYLYCDVYVRADGAEFAAIQVLPWTVWSALAVLLPRGRWTAADGRHALAAVPAVAAGVLAHNFLGIVVVGVAVAMVPVALALRVVVAPAGARALAGAAPRAAAWLVAIAAALLATAFFWLPALAEMPFTRIAAMREGYYHYAGHFLTPANLLGVRFWGIGESVPGPGDGMPLHLGWPSLAAVVSAAVALGLAAVGPAGRRRRIAGAVCVGGAALAGVLFFTFEASAGVWARVGVLQFAQFPWRLLGAATVPVCLLVPAAGVALQPRAPRLAAATMLALGAALFALGAHDYGRIAGTLPSAGQTAVVDWTRARITTANLDEYGPRWRPTDRPPHPPAGTVTGRDGTAVIERAPRGAGVAVTVDHRAGDAGEIVVALNYFPGWRATLAGGVSLAVSPEPATGFIRVGGIPPGRALVLVEFGNTPVRLAAKAASLAVVAVWLAACLVLARPRRTRS